MQNVQKSTYFDCGHAERSSFIHRFFLYLWLLAVEFYGCPLVY